MLIRHFQSWMMVFLPGCQELSKELPGADWTGHLIQIVFLAWTTESSGSVALKPTMQDLGAYWQRKRGLIGSWWALGAEFSPGSAVPRGSRSLLWISISSSVKCRFASQGPTCAQVQDPAERLFNRRDPTVKAESRTGLTDGFALPRVEETLDLELTLSSLVFRFPDLKM